MQNYISIIIPTLNEEKYIGKCLEALTRVDSPNIEYEIIVVDNGSIDNTVEIAKSFNAKVLIKKDAHIAELRNMGAMNSKGNILAFVDADCIVSQQWLQNAINCLEDTKSAVVGCVYKIPANSLWVGKVSDIISQKRRSGYVNYLPAGNIIVKKDCFFEVNGFDESLETNEDYDLCYRLREKGYKIFSDPSIESVHLGTPNTISHLFKRELWHGTSTFKVFIKDFKKARNLKVILFSIFIWFCLINIVIGLGVLVLIGNSIYVTISLLFLILLIGGISLRTAIMHAKIDMLPYIFVYYFIYGLARGVSLFKAFSSKSLRISEINNKLL